MLTLMQKTEEEEEEVKVAEAGAKDTPEHLTGWPFEDEEEYVAPPSRSGYL